MNDVSQNIPKCTTPAYYFSVTKALENYLDLKQALQTKLILSVKANPYYELLRQMAHLTHDGYEIASPKELALVANIDTPLFINNHAADINFLQAACALGAVIIIDNYTMLQKLAAIAQDHLAIKPVILRINVASLLIKFQPSTRIEVTEYFGIDLNEINEYLLKIKQSGLKIYGLHIFNGSNNFSNNTKLIKYMGQLISDIEKTQDYQLQFINLGGGFAANWAEQNLDFENYRQKYTLIPEHISLAHESGRGVFASAGYFITKIIATKQLDDLQIAICDGGIAQNFLLCQTEQQIKIYKQPNLRRDSGLPFLISTKPIIYLGSSCNSKDILAKVPAGGILPQANDFCIFSNCGAYNSTYSVSKFLGLSEANIYVD